MWASFKSSLVVLINGAKTGFTSDLTPKKRLSGRAGIATRNQGYPFQVPAPQKTALGPSQTCGGTHMSIKWAQTAACITYERHYIFFWENQDMPDGSAIATPEDQGRAAKACGAHARSSEKKNYPNFLGMRPRGHTFDKRTLCGTIQSKRPGQQHAVRDVSVRTRAVASHSKAAQKIVRSEMEEK
ncbi:hypothetical protein B0H13DRAFT_1854807 [Mycena leptocephala]|nr:hypothetical protein B0H13DRAFT_1854807 [Mycena leptocephala]